MYMLCFAVHYSTVDMQAKRRPITDHDVAVTERVVGS